MDYNEKYAIIENDNLSGGSSSDSVPPRNDVVDVNDVDVDDFEQPPTPSSFYDQQPLDPTQLRAPPNTYSADLLSSSSSRLAPPSYSSFESRPSHGSGFDVWSVSGTDVAGPPLTPPPPTTRLPRFPTSPDGDVDRHLYQSSACGGPPSPPFFDAPVSHQASASAAASIDDFDAVHCPPPSSTAVVNGDAASAPHRHHRRHHQQQQQQHHRSRSPRTAGDGGEDRGRRGQMSRLLRRRPGGSVLVAHRGSAESFLADVFFWPVLFVLNLPCFIASAVLFKQSKKLLVSGKDEESRKKWIQTYVVGFVGILFSALLILILAAAQVAKPSKTS